MHAFDYEVSATLADAIAQMARHDGRARPLAGGTDLIDQMRIGRFSPELLIDVKKITELGVLAVDAAGRQLAVAVDAQRLEVWNLEAVRKQFRELGLDWRDR